MNIFFEYIKYRWNAKELQGIHSPFVFDLMNTGLTKSMSKEDELAVLKFVSIIIRKLASLITARKVKNSNKKE